MLTIAQMIDANNRAVRRARFGARFDRLLMRALFLAAAFGVACAALALITTDIGPLQ